jgi:hypothetical protein
VAQCGHEDSEGEAFLPRIAGYHDWREPSGGEPHSYSGELCIRGYRLRCSHILFSHPPMCLLSPSRVEQAEFFSLSLCLSIENGRNTPAGSGWYVMDLDESECKAKMAGLYGCKFDTNGNATACGMATLDEKNDDLVIVEATK